MTDALREKLVDAGRVLVSEDQGDYVAGHATVRLPGRDGRLLTKPAGIGLEAAAASLRTVRRPQLARIVDQRRADRRPAARRSPHGWSARSPPPLRGRQIAPCRPSRPRHAPTDRGRAAGRGSAPARRQSPRPARCGRRRSAVPPTPPDTSPSSQPRGSLPGAKNANCSAAIRSASGSARLALLRIASRTCGGLGPCRYSRQRERRRVRGPDGRSPACAPPGCRRHARPRKPGLVLVLDDGGHIGRIIVQIDPVSAGHGFGRCRAAAAAAPDSRLPRAAPQSHRNRRRRGRAKEAEQWRARFPAPGPRCARYCAR